MHTFNKEEKRGGEACFPLNVLSEMSELQFGDKILAMN